MVTSGVVLISGERRTAHFRAHERRPVLLTASVWHPGGSDAAPAQVINLGLAGAGVSCPTLLRQEERVMLTLQSQHLLDALVLGARVAWVQMPQRGGLYYAGLAFEAPERGALLTLFQLLGTLAG